MRTPDRTERRTNLSAAFVGALVLVVAGTGLVAEAASRPSTDIGSGAALATLASPGTTSADGIGGAADASGTTAPPAASANEMPLRTDAPVRGTPATAAPPSSAATPTPPTADAGASTSAAPATTEPPELREQACVVTLHGKGGGGAAPRIVGSIVELAPSGNAAGWGGRQWRYDDAASFAQARDVVRAAVDDAPCTRVIVHGFSNGAAFAAKLYCRGESFDGRLVRVVVDDPVTDGGVIGCTPALGVALTLYWTGALVATAPAGWACAAADWTCEGGTSIGIDAYAAALRTPVVASPMGGHAMYAAAPDRTRF